MKKKERAALIQAILDHSFPDPKPSLSYSNNFELLVATLLSAQTTDRQVNQVTPSLFSRAATPEKMAKLSYDTLLSLIHPCGLAPKKAKAILELSCILVEQYHGKVPHTFQSLEKLPGVGHKTASVVMLMGFDKPAFPVDTHIFRLAKRWGLSTGKTLSAVEKDLKGLFPKKSWRKLHLQMIYCGRKYCPARGHKIEQCPICSQLHSAIS